METNTSELNISSGSSERRYIFRYLIIGALGLLLLIATFMGGAYYNARKVSQVDQGESTKVSSTIPNSNDAQDDTWKLYEDNTYGFSIKYPSSIDKYMDEWQDEFMKDRQEDHKVPMLAKRDETSGNTTADYDMIAFWRGPDSAFNISIFNSPETVPLYDFWKSRLPQQTICAPIIRGKSDMKRGFCYATFTDGKETFTETYEFEFFDRLSDGRDVFALNDEVWGIGEDRYVMRLNKNQVVLIESNLGDVDREMIQSMQFTQRNLDE